MSNIRGVPEAIPMRNLITGFFIATAACGSYAADPVAGEESMQRDDPRMIERRQEALSRKSLERTPTVQAGVVGEVPEALLEKVREDLEKRVGDKKLFLSRAEAVTWPSGALGCPEPGMAYTQALVPGYHVVFEVDGKSWDYRMNQGGWFKLCEMPALGNRPLIYPSK